MPRITLMLLPIAFWLVAAASERPLVGHIMALLAVFEQAEVLPPESSPDANALIHALIQTQAALTKTTHQATSRWFSEAVRKAAGEGGVPTEQALTSRTLEAIVEYARLNPPGRDPAVLAGLREFNVGPRDFELIARVYENAKRQLGAAGLDIHALYEKKRQRMPFH